MLPGCTLWPDEFEERYLQAGYWSTTATLGSLGGKSDKIALTDDDRSVSYGELDALADRIAGGMHDMGLRPGDRIVLQLPNTVEFVAVLLAALRSGIIPVLALTSHRANEICFLCRHSGSLAYIMPGSYQGYDYGMIAEEVVRNGSHVRFVISAGGGPWLQLAELCSAKPINHSRAHAQEVAFLLLSGGTTGAPKLIPRTHRDYSYQLRACAEAVGLREDSVYLVALPAGHNAALGCPGVLGSLERGATVVLASSPNPAEVFPAIQIHGVTHTTLMPSILKFWIEMLDFIEADLSKVLFQVGGSNLEPTVARAVRGRLGARLTHWFGMAEGFLSCTRLNAAEESAVRSTGQPLSEADELRVVDENDSEVGQGSIGELQVRGPYTIRGYYAEDEYNRIAFTVDGFLRTGDLVRINEHGEMVVEGRLKDVVNRGGEKIPVQELEEMLSRHPGVHQVVVIGLPDASLGEKTCALIVAGNARPLPGDLRRFLIDAQIAEFKIPDRFEFVSELPLTALGKVDKKALRNRLAADGHA